MVNKVDAADPVVLAQLKGVLPDALFVSAHTGEGVPALRSTLAELLPHPQVDVHVLLPYTRGDLVARLHQEGELLEERHTGEGTELRAKVRADLGHALEQFALDAVGR